MNFPSKILEKAVEAIASLPGIGKKTALRLALHLIYDDSDKASRLADAIVGLKSEIKFCNICHTLADGEVCDICKSTTRSNHVLCVVENIRDLLAIEDTGQFFGKYHVLGGLISPLEGVGPSDLNIDSLVDRVKRDEVEELIMAISPTIEGETTIFYISKLLKDLPVKISTIARGVAFGGDLEYADEFTLGKSIQARIPYTRTR